MTAATASRPVTGWWGYRPVPRLLGSRARMAVNAGLRAGPEQRGWTLILGTLAVAWWLGSHRLAEAVISAGGAPSPGSLEPSLAAGLATLCGVVAVTSVSFAISGLYFARDLEMLLVAPLAARAVLLAKLSVQLAVGVGMATLLAGPWLVAYLSAQGALAALPVVAVAAVALATLPLCLGTAVTIATVRILPARRVRDAAALLVTGTVFAVTAVNVVLRTPDGSRSTTPLALDAPGRGRIADLAWLPTGWAARAVEAAVRGDLVATALLSLLLLATGAAALLLVSRLGEAAFVAGHQRAEAGEGRSRRRSAARLRGGGLNGPRRVWVAIALKDLRELRRDAAQLGQLVLPIALFALYIAVPGQAPSAGASIVRLPAWFTVSLTAGFASLFAASGVALRGVGAEGRRLWLLRSAPVRAEEVLLAKFAVGLAVSAGLGLALLAVGGIREHLPPAELALAGVRLLVIVAGLVALATGLGAVRPRLDWTDPRRSVGVGQSLGFLGLGSLYLALCFVMLAVPYAHRSPGAGAVTAGDAGVVVLAALSAALALRAGVARLRSIEL